MPWLVYIGPPLIDVGLVTTAKILKPKGYKRPISTYRALTSEDYALKKNIDNLNANVKAIHESTQPFSNRNECYR